MRQVQLHAGSEASSWTLKRHFHCGRLHLTSCSCFSTAAPPTPGTQPEAGMDFTGLPVHDLMRLYYSESASRGAT
jgi:hypothetical protein